MRLRPPRLGPRLPLLLAAALLPLLTPPPLRAEGVADPEGRRQAVLAAVTAAQGQDPAARRALAGELAQEGGPVALTGLARLAADGDPGVRQAVHEAATAIGLRSEALRARAREDAAAPVVGLRRAAVAALGVLGDGRDVPFLLGLGADEAQPPALRRAAFAALRTLGGVQIPYEARRWRWWWRERSHRATEQLPPALASLEAPDGSSELALRMIADLGWVDLPATRELLATWLQGGTTAQAAAAAHLVGALRLADLADEVGFALEVRTGAALRAAAEATLRQLGVPLA